VGYAWIPGASYLEAREDGGRMRGGAPRAVWQALDTDPELVSAKSAAQHLDQTGCPAHLVWNPLTGEIVQLISALRAGRRLGGPDGPGPAGPASLEDRAACASSGVGTEGRVCIQIAVVAFAWEPFTDGPLIHQERILTWLDSWQVPRRWPAGRPSPFEQAHAGQRSRRLWASGGHFGASQVPASGAVGPGAIDTGRLTGPGSPTAVGIPPPRLDSQLSWATARAVAPVRLAGAQLPDAASAASAALAQAATLEPAAASATGSPAASGMH
jgi:hypothetical protein